MVDRFKVRHQEKEALPLVYSWVTLCCDPEDADLPSLLIDGSKIQLLLGHASIQTTERYLGTVQNLTVAANDAIGLEMD